MKNEVLIHTTDAYHIQNACWRCSSIWRPARADSIGRLEAASTLWTEPIIEDGVALAWPAKLSIGTWSLSLEGSC